MERGRRHGRCVGRRPAQRRGVLCPARPERRCAARRRQRPGRPAGAGSRPQGRGRQRERLPTFDHTLRLAKVVFDDAPGQALAAAGPVWNAVRQALDLALVALAGEQAGGASRTLEITTQYAKVRNQFGRAIGSFQAIKHMAADLLFETESAMCAARNAAQRWPTARPTPRNRRARRVHLRRRIRQDGRGCVQMHGGIGFTWAHPAHLYLRRARADAQLFGAPAAHRERYLEASEPSHGRCSAYRHR